MSEHSADSTLFDPNPLSTPDVLRPDQIRVVDLESDEAGTVVRFDCYEPGAEEKMFRLVGDAVQVCAIDWADTDDMDPEVAVEWTSTGLSYWEVDRIRVFSWPAGELIRVYRDVE
jgi:hypothetical protein